MKKMVLIEVFKLGGIVALEDEVTEIQSNYWLNFGDFPPTILFTQKLKSRFSKIDAPKIDAFSKNSRHFQNVPKIYNVNFCTKKFRKNALRNWHAKD